MQTAPMSREDLEAKVLALEARLARIEALLAPLLDWKVFDERWQARLKATRESWGRHPMTLPGEYESSAYQWPWYFNCPAIK